MTLHNPLCSSCSPSCNPSCNTKAKIYLQPGDWYFGDHRACARTTLGSCVAFTFWHSRLRIGGICHYMLAHRASGVKEPVLGGRYADEALELLDQAAREHGTQLRDYEVKLFGGADMLYLPNRLRSSVASCNIEAARALVPRYGLHVTAESLGGRSYRQLVFSISTGEVWMRQGPEAPRPTLLESAARGVA